MLAASIARANLTLAKDSRATTGICDWISRLSLIRSDTRAGLHLTRAGRDTEVRRRPQPDAARGAPAGALDPRELDDRHGVAGLALLQQPRVLRSHEARGDSRDHHRGAGREVVVAGRLPQPGLLPAQGREVA